MRRPVRRTSLAALTLLTATLACANNSRSIDEPGAIDGAPPPVTPASELDKDWEADNAACTACLEQGKTWQPEADECTSDCDIMDISCYREACPKRCAESCGACFSEADCSAAGCTWHQAAEAMWCTK